MSEFKKYPSIENSYREKEISHWLTLQPLLQTETFLITEKVDGCNFQWLITKDGLQFGKRTTMLAVNESFYDHQNTMKKYTNEIDSFKQYLIDNELESIIVFGELFGLGIQKSVKYGDTKRFKIFDIYIDNILLAPYSTIEILKELDMEYMYVPTIAIIDGLTEALNYETRFNSKLFDTDEENICEGIVIKPMFKTYMNGISPFFIKKKNKEFSEIQHEPKIYIVDEELEAVRNTYKQYLNENRVKCVMSKFGEIDSPKDIGRYIKYVLNDAKKDFLKDNMELFISLEDKQKKQVFGITGSVIVPILNTYL